MNLSISSYFKIFHGSHGFDSSFSHRSAHRDVFKPLYDFFCRATLPANHGVESNESIAFQLPPVSRRITKESETGDLQALLCLSKDSNRVFSATPAAKNLPKLKRYSALLEKIPDAEKPPEIRGIACTQKNFKQIESYLQARDKICVWEAVAESMNIEGAPSLKHWETLEAFVQKAQEFNAWIDKNPASQEITDLAVKVIHIFDGFDDHRSQSVNDRALTSIPVEIGRFTKLRSLNLSDSQISKIEGLEKLTQLQTLDLSGNQISKIEGLDQLTQLQTLDLSDNQISKIEGLDRLVQLKHLRLKENQISKIEGLDQLVLLEILCIFDNQISKIEGLDRLTQLTALGLNGNQIKKIEGLDQLIQLKGLALNQNKIRKIEGINQLQSLISLWLGCNNISKIEGLEQLQHLLDLDLSRNNISKIEGLEQLSSLQAVVLAENPLGISEEERQQFRFEIKDYIIDVTQE